MFNSFPQPKPDSGGGAPWMADWSAYQTIFDWTGTQVSIPSASWNTFVDITGSGWLTFVNSSSNLNSVGMPDVKVTIDGIPYIFSGSTTGTTAFTGNLISQPIFFKSSLKIEVYNRDAAAQNYFCDYAYLLKNSNPNPSKQSILLASSRNMAHNRNNTTSNVNVANISGSGYLLAIEFSGEQITAIDASTTLATVAIDGVNKISDRALIGPAQIGYKQHYFPGPIRFNTSLLVSHRASSTNVVANTRVWYSLD